MWNAKNPDALLNHKKSTDDNSGLVSNHNAQENERYDDEVTCVPPPVAEMARLLHTRHTNTELKSETSLAKRPQNL